MGRASRAESQKVELPGGNIYTCENLTFFLEGAGHQQHHAHVDTWIDRPGPTHCWTFANLGSETKTPSFDPRV
jgi:hypothetical protein